MLKIILTTIALTLSMVSTASAFECYNGWEKNFWGKCKPPKPTEDDQTFVGSLDYHTDEITFDSIEKKHVRSSKDCLSHGKHGCRRWKTPEQIYADKQKVLKKFKLDDESLELMYDLQQQLLDEIGLNK